MAKYINTSNATAKYINTSIGMENGGDGMKIGGFTSSVEKGAAPQLILPKDIRTTEGLKFE